MFQGIVGAEGRIGSPGIAGADVSEMTTLYTIQHAH